MVALVFTLAELFLEVAVLDLELLEEPETVPVLLLVLDELLTAGVDFYLF
ncbi:hypothetical protein JCM19296_3480 [Nonlabens ulvanivorans]|uniref:Uncharacterized protein n=1 Tax=Nonlabens ulvanivorans TaxID=906888 RepID=A0A081DG25_NONUL|nr:hypothetical protein JCM19296_3480 [Nonlabens ulvanivorans]